MVLFLSFTSNAFSFQTEFTPQISITEEYTDNLFLSNEDEEEEFITLISPGFSLRLSGKSSGAEISYNPAYSIYSELDEYNSWRHNVDLSAWSDLTKYTRIEIGESYLYTEDPIEKETIFDPDRDTNTTVRQNRETYYTNDLSVGVLHRFHENSQLALRYTYSILENDDPQYEDTVYHTPSIEVIHWISALWGMEAALAYTEGDFEQSDDRRQWDGTLRVIRNFTRNFSGFLRYSHAVINYEGESEDYQSYNPAIGFDYRRSEDLLLSMDVGYVINDFDDGSQETGLSTDASLTKNFQRGAWQLLGSAGYEESRDETESLGLTQYWEIGSAANYQFAKNVTGDIFGFYRKDDYQDIEPERDDGTTRIGCGLDIYLLKWMTVRFEYANNRVESTEDENEYVENRGSLMVTAFPVTPYRFGK